MHTLIRPRRPGTRSLIPFEPWAPTRLPIEDITRRDLLRRAGVVLLAAACGTDAEPAAAPRGTTPATRTVIDYAGRAIEVPPAPSEVIGLDGTATANLISLGLTPVGVNERIEGQFVGMEHLLPAGMDLGAIPAFGDSYEPDFESLASIAPEMIVGNEFMEELYDNLRQIAPTVLVAWPSNGAWRQRFLDVAEAVGRSDRAREVEADYEAFIEDLPEGLDQTRVAFIRPDEGLFRIDSVPEAFPGSVARDAGIPLFSPPEGIGEIDEGSGFIEVSSERLGVLEQADLIVVPDFTVTGAAEDDSLTQFATNPLWDGLPAVRDGRVVQVPGLVYNGGNHFAAKALLQQLAAQIG